VLAGAGVAAASPPAGGGRGAAHGVFARVATFSTPPDTGTVAEPLSAQPLDLGAHGYVQHELFAAGTAHAFRADAAPSDGRWTVSPTTAATYRTRILVRRPANPARFSGTVVVEWLNESAGESSPDWDFLNPYLMRAGDAYVGVTVQQLGVDGGTPILGSIGSAGAGLVHEDPARYGTLHHPGDRYALDMFAQIGLGLRTAGGRRALGPLRPRHVVAVGESQSAFYLTTFADALQPVTHAFDGIFIHSRGGGGAPLNGASVVSGSLKGGLRIRTDLHVPVFMFETQTDVIELGYASAQQPDTPRVRTWEVAGTSHADAFLVGAAASLLGCTTSVNSGPQHEVAQAAFAAFTRWVVHGTPPPSPPRFRLSSRHPATLALDRYGNVLGGVRTPAVDVPVSTLSGAAPAGASALCALFGSTTAFTQQQLVSLYHSQAGYLARYRASLGRAIAGGYVLAATRSALVAQARQVQFPAGATGS
ncbi:MAG: alpha/beta hydrolase domain-containing protein, partial [Acidimicrobiales bacterium]